MSEFTKYRRTQVAEMRPYVEGERLDRKVSVSMADRGAGSPKVGDMIARNPANHEDQWLVAADYFAANFEPLAAPSPETGTAAGPTPTEVFTGALLAASAAATRATGPAPEPVKPPRCEDLHVSPDGLASMAESAIRAAEPVKPPARPCKPWCGTNEVPAKVAYYTRKGLFYCRDRCVKAATRAARTPAAGTAPTPDIARAVCHDCGPLGRTCDDCAAQFKARP